MDCKVARDWLSPYLDGELSAAEKAALAEHLKICSSCRQELQELAAAVQMLRRVPELAPASGFRAKLRESLEREEACRQAGLNERAGLAQPAGEQKLPPANPPAALVLTDAGKTCTPAQRPENKPGRVQTLFSFFLAGGKVWPRLAAAATLLLAVGIASWWYGLAGTRISPGVPADQLVGSLTQKDQFNREELKNAQKKVVQEYGYYSSAQNQPAGEAPKTGQTETEISPVPPGAGKEVARFAIAAAPERKTSPGREESNLRVQPPAEATKEEEITKEESQQYSVALSLEKSKGVPGGSASPQAPEKALETSPDEQHDGVGLAIMAAVPLKKVTREIRIELKNPDVPKLALLLSRFARQKEVTAEQSARYDVYYQDMITENYLSEKIELSRIPDFMAEIKSVGVIVKQEEKTQDIPAEYFQLATVLKEKKLKEEEIQQLILANNKNNRSTREPDILPQEELQRVRAEIQAIKTKLQKMNQELQTVSVTIRWQK